MGKDRRYPAFLFILAVLLGFFLYTSGESRKGGVDPQAAAGSVPVAADAPAAAGDRGPAPSPSAASPARAKKTTLPVFPIDINTATVQDLVLLPGIGEKTAQRIVEKRAELGRFETVDDLTAVKWIGKVKLEKIRALVKVSPLPDGQGRPGQ